MGDSDFLGGEGGGEEGRERPQTIDYSAIQKESILAYSSITTPPIVISHII